MNKITLIVLAAACCITVVALAQQESREKKAIMAALENRKKLVADAQQKYDLSVKTAIEARDKKLALANKSATTTLLAIARRMTQSGKLAEAITAYKVVCSYEPTNKEAVKALTAVGIKPQGAEVAQAAGEFKRVEYRLRVQVSVNPTSPGWTKVSKEIRTGEIVHFEPSGNYTVANKQYSPKGLPSEEGNSYHLQARFTASPTNVFDIGAGGKMAAPGDGTLELRLAIPTNKRKLAAGKVSVIIAVQK